MYFCLRVDVDYVPWDSPDAKEFGHGEPAMILRLLDLCKQRSYRCHFFLSNRVLRAFPTIADAVLNEDHDLDWFCKHPEDFDTRFSDARELFRQAGHQPIGLCIRGPWQEELISRTLPSELRFLSASPGPHPSGVILFPVDTSTDRDTVRGGSSVRNWTDTLKQHIRFAASKNVGTTVCIRPQVMATFDPNLTHLRELIDFADAVGLKMRTLRELLVGSAT